MTYENPSLMLLGSLNAVVLGSSTGQQPDTLDNEGIDTGHKPTDVVAGLDE